MRKGFAVFVLGFSLLAYGVEPELEGLPRGTELLGAPYDEALKINESPGPRASSEIIPVDAPFAKAVRVTVPEKRGAPSTVQLRAAIAQKVEKGDLVVLIFHLRSSGPGGCEALSLVECNEPKWAGLVVATARAEGEWKRFLVVGTAKQDFPPGKTALSFQLGNKQQTLEIGGVTLVNFGTAVSYNATTKKFSAGSAADAGAPLVFRADGRWKALDTGNLQVAPGSALDLSRLVDGPSGKYGRVTLTPDGGLSFADRPTAAVRFFAFNELVNHLFDQPDTALAAATEEQTRENCRAYAVLVRRHGYNMIRLHYVDFYLSTGAPADFECNPEKLDRFDYLIYCLKQEGVYFGLDAMSFTGLKRATWSEGVALRYKERLLVEPQAREVWEKSVRVLMTHRNPYTKLSFNEDPSLVYVTLFNEQDLGAYLGNFEGPALRPLAERKWRDFLNRRYRGDFAALVRGWGSDGAKAGGGATFDSIPFYEKKDAASSGQRGNDIGLFLHEIEADMHAWYLETIRAIGYSGMTALYDVLTFFRHQAIHNESRLVVNHGYHALPSDGEKPGSRLAQDSAVATAANYWRSRAMARLLNRPFMVTEYGSPYWGRYRHEEGLFYPAYAALQKTSAITVHEQAVSMRSKPLLECYAGRDPITRAGQVVAAFLYQRGDVSPSPHTVALAVNDAFIFTNGMLNRTVNSEQSKVVLLCGFGVQYDKKFPAGLPPYRMPDLILLPADGG
ncbi:MAG: hypothetical protein J0L75_00600 [Spirochaetes bacterium]|nr:hypothetical protein [Spirochaetota bacterium]